MKIFNFIVAGFTVVFMLGASAQEKLSEQNLLKATIIGSGSPQFNHDRAGPAVLIQHDDFDILVDTGNGTQAHLNTLGIKIKQIDGLFYTHHHLDHNEEFIPIFIRSLLGDNKFKLVGPPPMVAMSQSVLKLYETDIEYRMRRSRRILNDVVDNYETIETSDESQFSIGKIDVRTTKVNHTIDTIAYRFDVDGYSVVISGDLSYSESLIKLAKNADVLIIDSGGTIKKNPKSKRKGGNKNNNKSAHGKSGTKRNGHQRAHVTLDETAKMAAGANVKKLVLTHFTTGENDEVATIAELRKEYKGEIVFATDLMIVTDGQAVKTHNKNGQNKAPRSKASMSTRPTNPCTETPEWENLIEISESGDTRRISANAIPAHNIGAFPNSGNPNKLTEQKKTYSVSMSPSVEPNITYLYDRAIDYGRPSYVFGVALNGVKFEPMANEYFIGSNGPNYEWTVEALSKDVFLGDDCNNAHIQPNGEYHYHGSPIGLISSLTNKQKPKDMLLVGWAADGFPIYYSWGYEKKSDKNSKLIELKSSYELKPGKRSGNGRDAPDGDYNGLYVRDYVYREGLGNLDQCNGREGVTPEFPNGIYYYALTHSFPFIGRCLVGEPSVDFKIGGGNRTRASRDNVSRHSNQRNPEQLMARMDRNNDGKISPDEARGRLKENFTRRDRNNDGVLTLNELSRQR